MRLQTVGYLGGGAVILAAGLALLGWQAGGVLAFEIYAGVALIVLVQARAFHPHSAFGAANGVTTVRAALACLVAAGLALSGAPPDPALAWRLAALAGLSLALDGLDGLLARRLGLCSAFGARYDMEIDALLILLLSVAAWLSGKAGAWVMLIGAMRYAFAAAGRLWPSLRAPLPVSLRRKGAAVVQAVALGLLLAPPIRPPASGRIAAVALAALAASFAVDVIWLLRAGSASQAAGGRLQAPS